MDPFTFFFNKESVAFFASLALFLLGLYFAMQKNRLTVGALLFLYSLVAGLAIANYQEFGSAIKQWVGNNEDLEKRKLTHFKREIIKAYDELKSEWQLQKQNFDDLLFELRLDTEDEKARKASN